MENNVKPIEKGEICNIFIEDMSSEGMGIGRTEGLVVFVGGAVVGDEVEAEITKVKKNYAFAKLLKITKPSEHRREKHCGYAGECGGCMLAEVDYEGQLELKEKQVRSKMSRIAGIENALIRPIIGMDDPVAYRNKAQMQISCGGLITRKGGVMENLGECSIGFYRGKSHDVVNCERCLLQAPPAMAVADVLRRFVKSDNIIAYDPKWEKGLLRRVVVKTAFGTGEVMVILVCNGKGIGNAAKLVEMLDDAVAELPPYEDGTYYSLESVVINVNKTKDSTAMGDECITIAGSPVIREVVRLKGSVSGNEAGMSCAVSDADDKFLQLEFEISPLSFYQVNPVQMKELYQKVLDYAALKGDETVLDLYCGVGTIGIFCANEMRRLTKKKYGTADFEKMGKVIGIESIKGAVADANRNAVINGLANAWFVCGKAEEKLPDILSGKEIMPGMKVENSSKENDEYVCSENALKPDVIVLDPPRSGCKTELLETAVSAAPGKIIYVSCDPATLARDIAYLEANGYSFIEATPVDMFPHTGHVETCCLLERLRNAKDHVTFTLDMEDYYRIKDAETDKKNDSKN
ncbi:MAG: 23S rRNA (uracil(1939)-C(5))-methyltransferase RlmD [Clostridia bacterium]|nr:23S rRNA (uracil(1939)-C(5))-methyltransferase RlmD [Clostridia bacterium]